VTDIRDDTAFHILRMEVTVAASLVDPDGGIAGDNMVDATLAFGWRTSDPPAGMTDAQVNKALVRGVSPVLATIQTALTFNGWVAMGEVDEPMKDASHPTGEMSRSDPITVHVSFPDEKAAIHD
jgi:hypothetical protein